MNVNEKIGIKLRGLREKHNYSLEDVAKLIGKSRKTVHSYEMGDISISVDNLKKLCEVFDYTVGRFLDEID